MIKIFELNLFRTDFKCDSCGEWFSSVPGYEGKLLNLNLRLTPSECIKSTCKACVAMCCTLAGNHDNSVNKLSPKFGSHHTKEALRYTVSAYGYTGLLIFCGKKVKFRGIFRGKFAEKSADFAGFSREKSQNSRNNRPISRDFRGKKESIFEGFSGANS